MCDLVPHRASHSFPTRRSSDLDVHPDRAVARRRGVDRHARLRGARDDGVVRAAGVALEQVEAEPVVELDRKSTRLNSSHLVISYAVFCLNTKNAEVHATD